MTNSYSERLTATQNSLRQAAHRGITCKIFLNLEGNRVLSRFITNFFFVSSCFFYYDALHFLKLPSVCLLRNKEENWDNSLKFHTYQTDMWQLQWVRRQILIFKSPFHFFNSEALSPGTRFSLHVSLVCGAHYKTWYLKGFQLSSNRSKQ